MPSPVKRPKLSLPEWADCEAAVDHGNASALEVFIYNHEPSSKPLERQFREQLLALIKDIVHV